MWVGSRLMWEVEFDWSAGEHDQGQGGLWGVEAVGAFGDRACLVVRPFVASVGQPRVTAAAMPSACRRMVREALTKVGGRDRWAREHRVSRSMIVSGSKSPAKIARRASLS